MDLELDKILEECHSSEEECQKIIDQLLSNNPHPLTPSECKVPIRHEAPCLSRYYPDDITEARTFEEYLEMKVLLPTCSSIPMELRKIQPQESQYINPKILLYIVLMILCGCMYLQL